MRFRSTLLAALGGAAWLSAAAAAPEPGSASAGVFQRDVRPVLLARCAGCHGEQIQRNGLRLDRGALVLQGSDAGPAVVPGKSGESELIRRVESRDPKKVMPPAGPPLTPAQVQSLRAWIDGGAQVPEETGGDAVRSTHWSFQPVRRPPLPAVKLKSWVINPIDAFVLARLEAKGIRPSPSADRATLVRRASLDLTGLPPTPDEVDAFLNDRVPGAYERAVERLLASPHYGERWGRHWLDQARYADSNGFTIDSARSIWKYRDWVIDALNRDLPFDRFTIEQLAGDMLPNATQSQVIATGFHRNTLTNEEGGTDPEQFRVESVVDRVNTTGAVWLGLTVGCAQCHTHKYDPITQREYYQFYAFLNNADEPAFPMPTPDQARELEAVKRDLAQVQQSLAEFDRRPAALTASLPTAAWSTLRGEARAAKGTRLSRLDDGSLLAAAPVPENDVYTFEAPAPGGPVTAVRLEVLTHASLPGGGPGFGGGNFLLTDIELSAGGRELPISHAVADHEQKDYPITATLDGDPRTGWAINVLPGQGNLHTARTAVFLLKDPLDVPTGTPLTVTLRQEHPNRRYLIGRFRLSVTAAPAGDAAVLVPESARQLLAVPEAQRTAEQRQKLAEELRKLDPERARLATRLATLQAREKELNKGIVSTLVMKERAEPRDTHIQIRGDFLRLGARVEPGVPAVLPPLPADVKKPTRLDLARWLVEPRNPLTPRVTVNRVWQVYFGTGIVDTENDFGRQGGLPTHPELLDYLAHGFAHGDYGLPGGRPGGPPWSLKALHRLIVTSATYRQASRMRPELRDLDPQNRLLAHQNRLRVEAEVVRDVALAACGLLSRKIGGPSVFPPQPGGLDLFTQSKKNWTPSKGEDRYRRGMYTFFWRSSPYAMFATFDAPGGNVTCTRRNRSNTPLGALMLANDQSMVEMAQALAATALRDVPGGGAADEERLRYAFRRALSRQPSSIETGRLMDYYRGQVARFQAAPAEAEKVAPRERPAGVDAPTGAAWSAVARVLMNLDEFITRE